MVRPAIQAIGPYEIVGVLGEGGMAIVFKAVDTRLSRNVAIKMIRPAALEHEAILQRFEREAKTLAQLNHPNIVKILDYGSYEDQPYLVMEFISGGTYKQKTTAPMDYRSAARALLPVARALDYAHRKKVLHRDIKPANILIDENGEPKLSDFGIAKSLAPVETTELTGTGMAIGTPAYMAPEQFIGGADDLRSDIYSLGVVFFEMLTGQVPFQSNTPAGIIARQASSPVPRPSTLVHGLPPEVDRVLLKAMEKLPEQRYQTMGEFVRALETMAEGGSPAFEPSSGSQTLLRRAAKPWPGLMLALGGLGAAALLTLLAAGSLGLWWLSQTTTSSPGKTPSASPPVSTASGAAGGPATFAPTRITPAVQPSLTLPAAATSTRWPASPTPGQPTASPTPADPSLIFRDDFSDRGSGWTIFEDASGKADYEGNRFRILITEAQLDLWSNPQLGSRQDVRVSVEAQQASNIDNNFFGVICRYTREISGYNFYFFGISGKGGAAIGKTLNSKQQYLARNSQTSAAINSGATGNKIAAICSGSTLQLLVNGAEVLSATDSDLTAGDVGLIAGTFSEPGVDILFDNFAVNWP